MRIYGHPRDEHSRLQARQVDFSANQARPENVVSSASNTRSSTEHAGQAQP